MQRDDVKMLVEQLVDEWKPILGMDRWTVSLHWTEKKKNTYATSTVLPEYHEISIRFNLELLEEESKLNIEHTVVHELCHAITQPLYQNMASDGLSAKLATYINESVVTMITEALLAARYGEHHEVLVTTEGGATT